MLRRPVTGTTVRVPFEHGGDNGRDGARRALVNFAISLTPNSYVIDIDPEAHSLLIHQLVADLPDRIARPVRGPGAVNAWLVAAAALLVGLVPCLVVMVRGSIVEALVGLQMAGVLETVTLMVLAEGFHRAPF